MLHDIVSLILPIIYKKILYFYSEIKMPPIIRKRGRPKGHNLTVIGIPKKKKSKTTGDEKKSYCLLYRCTYLTKKNVRVDGTCIILVHFLVFYIIVMLQWFVSEELANQVLKDNKQLIEEEDV